MNNSSYLVAAILNVLASILTVNVGFAQVSYRTDLVGEAEVPPLFSESTGSALIAGNDSSLKFQINVTSLDKVTSVSLYKGDDSENGQVLVSLLNSTEPSGLVEGKLVEGTINSSSILAPLANLTTNVTLNLPSSGNLTNLRSTVPAPGNMTNLTSAVPAPGNLTNLRSTVPAPGNLTNLTSAVPAPGNMTNLTSAVPAPGNMTNLTSNSGNMTSPAAPVSKLEALIDLMNQNMTYINIHTSQFPEGELRGTLVPTNSTG
ncbi:MAG: CHRD domain-containing protein [Nitrososphaeraceae archaeon]|nr:CHRD domain-containing protein [Nitrososphaeraceae archaeon]